MIRTGPIVQRREEVLHLVSTSRRTKRAIAIVSLTLFLYFIIFLICFVCSLRILCFLFTYLSEQIRLNRVASITANISPNTCCKICEIKNMKAVSGEDGRGKGRRGEDYLYEGIFEFITPQKGGRASPALLRPPSPTHFRNLPWNKERKT